MTEKRKKRQKIQKKIKKDKKTSSVYLLVGMHGQGCSREPSGAARPPKQQPNKYVINLPLYLFM